MPDHFFNYRILIVKKRVHIFHFSRVPQRFGEALSAFKAEGNTLPATADTLAREHKIKRPRYNALYESIKCIHTVFTGLFRKLIRVDKYFFLTRYPGVHMV